MYTPFQRFLFYLSKTLNSFDLTFFSAFILLAAIAVTASFYFSVPAEDRKSDKVLDDPRRRLPLVLAFLLVGWTCWHTPWLLPLRQWSVFIHELGHGLAALLTGGKVDGISLGEFGGMCHIRGGIETVILPAGDLGSMLAGALILILACRTRWDKYVSLALGLTLSACALVFIFPGHQRWLQAGLGAALAAAGLLLPEAANDFLLTYLGTSCCLYSFFDLREGLMLGKRVGDVADYTNKVFPLPPRVWAALWMLIGLAVFLGALKIALKFRAEPAKA